MKLTGSESRLFAEALTKYSELCAASGVTKLSIRSLKADKALGAVANAIGPKNFGPLYQKHMLK